MAKRIVFDEEARKSLLKGIDAEYEIAKERKNGKTSKS